MSLCETLMPSQTDRAPFDAAEPRGSSSRFAVARPEWPRIHLASSSPRRREMLTQHGIPHEACDPGIDDGKLIPNPGVLPEEWVAALAYLKAASAIKRFENPSSSDQSSTVIPEVVIGADTIVLHRSEIIGQPRDAEDARRIIQRLAGSEHSVLTGVALVRPATRQREIFHDVAHVRMGPLTEVAIDHYLASGLWLGKAGAYNLSERLSAGWKIEFDGDPTTIMGLPMIKLSARLRALKRA